MDKLGPSNVQLQCLIKAITWLRHVTDRPGENSEKHHELEVPLLYLLLNILVHLLLTEAQENQSHHKHSHEQVYQRYGLVEAEIELTDPVEFRFGHLEAYNGQYQRHHYRHSHVLLDPLLTR